MFTQLFVVPCVHLFSSKKIAIDVVECAIAYRTYVSIWHHGVLSSGFVCLVGYTNAKQPIQCVKNRRMILHCLTKEASETIS